MDKEALDKLLDGKSKDVQLKAVRLYTGMVTCANKYQSEPTSANRRNWEDSESALNKFVEQISAADGQENEDKPLPNIAAVLEYLRAADWRVTKTTLYRHQKEGKIAPRLGGLYALRDVDKYARTWLKQKSTGKKLSEKIEYLQELNLKLDRDLKELKIRREKIATMKEEGLYIPKEFMEIELAGRAGVLDAGLKHWVQSRAAEWIRSVGGDTKKVGDLILVMTRDLDDHINSYASTLSYQIVIDAEEEKILDPVLPDEDHLIEGEESPC